MLDPNAAYLVTGGLGALGLTVARALARWGARRLVLLGRRAGERFTAGINDRRQEIEVVLVRRPTCEEIYRVFPSLKPEASGA